MAISLNTLSLITFLLTTVLSVTLPVLVGIYVYKDARRRGMNAVLWALLSAFAPGFVGLIIYLLVRTDSSRIRCKSCNNLIKESFAVCPHCGTSLKEHCHTCNNVLESGWANCPQCGTEIPEDQKTLLNIMPKKDKGLKWLLMVLIVIPVLLLSILTASTQIRIKQLSGLHYFQQGYATVKDAIAEHPFLKGWIAECDANGKGIYQYRYEDGTTDKNTYRIFIYRNDGYTLERATEEKGGLFDTKNELHLHYGFHYHNPSEPVWDHTGSESVQIYYDYAINYFEFEDDDFTVIRAFDWQGNEVEIK